MHRFTIPSNKSYEITAEAKLIYSLCSFKDGECQIAL